MYSAKFRDSDILLNTEFAFFGMQFGRYVIETVCPLAGADDKCTTFLLGPYSVL